MKFLSKDEAIDLIGRKSRKFQFEKIFLTLFIPLVFIFLGIAAIIYYNEVNADIELLIAYEAEENTVNHLKIINYLDYAVTHLKWMADLVEVQKILSGNSEDERNELATEFLDIGVHTTGRVYDQLRILDVSGNEIVRVHLENNAYSTVPESKLQNKSDRYYFTQALKLKKGQVYMSELDLNIEEGTVQVPYKPMLRLATPLFDSQGQKVGVMVTNLLAQKLIDQLNGIIVGTSDRSVSKAGEYHQGHKFLLIDRFGHYLRGSTPEDEWGGSLGKEPLFPNHYPDVWESLGDSQIGKHKVGQGYLLSRSVHPCINPDCNLRTPGVFDIEAVTPGEHGSFHWNLIVLIPKAEIAKIKQGWLFNLALLVIVLSLIGGIGSFALAGAKERKNFAETEVLQVSNRLQSIMDNTSSVVFLKDLNGKYLMINKKFEELFHISQNDIIGKTDFDLFPEEAAQAFQELDRQALAAGEPIEGEEVVPQDDGLHTYISVKFPLVGSDGEPFGVGGIATDITDRKITEENAFKFKTIADQGSFGIAVTNLENVYTYVNRTLAAIHGYSIEEMVGTSAREYRAEIGREHTEALMEKYAEDGEFANVEVWRTHKDGHDFPLLASGMMVKDSDGNPMYSAISASDISGSKETENKLRESEAQLSATLNNMADGVGVVDLEENFTFCNPAMASILGVETGKLIGRNVKEFIDQALHQVIEEETSKRAKGEVDTYDITVTRPDGQNRIVRVTGSPKWDAKGKVTGTYGIVHDVTEERKWEEALKESERHYRELVEATYAAAWELDWKTKEITYMAPQIERMLGYPAGDWKNLSYWISKIHEADREWVTETGRQKTRKGLSYELEYRFVNSNDEVVWVRNLVTVVMGDTKPEKAMGLMLDITQVKNAEIKANKEYSKLKLMIETMDSGVAFADAEGTVIEINEAFCQLSGIPQGDTLGKNVSEIHHSFSARIQGLFRKVVDGYQNKTAMDPYVVQRKMNNKEIIFSVHPVFRDGIYDGVMTTIIDVSEIIDAQRKAEEATRAKSMFLANISHELRTPLTIINGFAEVLLDKQGSELSDIQTKYVAQIHESGQHLLEIISDLLDIARIEAGRMELDSQDSLLGPLCQNALDMAIPKNTSKPIEVVIDIPSDPVVCYCDPVRFRQVVINLVANAWKFTPQGKITLSLLDGDDFITISVEDTGIGIKQSEITRLLKPFEQVQNKFESEFVGTGLGLTLTRGIIEAHGGSLYAASELGVGSTFTVLLPKRNSTKAHG